MARGTDWLWFLNSSYCLNSFKHPKVVGGREYLKSEGLDILSYFLELRSKRRFLLTMAIIVSQSEKLLLSPWKIIQTGQTHTCHQNRT